MRLPGFFGFCLDSLRAYNLVSLPYIIFIYLCQFYIYIRVHNLMVT